MDLVWLIDWVGEPLTAISLGSLLGLLFGILAQRSAFCTRSAIVEIIDQKIRKQAPMWLLAFAVAVLGVQYLLFNSTIDVTETRFFSNPQSISGALIGGSLFGAGMILARGCASRLLVLGASGNLRAAFATLVLALTAYQTLNGFLSTVRLSTTGIFNTSKLGGNDALAVFGFTQFSGVVIGVLLLGGAVFFAIKHKLAIKHASAGLVIGAIIPFGWWATYSLSTQVFEPINSDSLSYIRPFSNTVRLIQSGFSEEYFSIDIGIIVGTFVGAFLAAIANNSFKVLTFVSHGSAPFWRYITGSIFMGFGGVLAAGCTIGAGFTGGSLLAIASLVSLGSMIFSASIMHKILDSGSTAIRNPE